MGCESDGDRLVSDRGIFMRSFDGVWFLPTHFAAFKRMWFCGGFLSVGEKGARSLNFLKVQRWD